MSNFIFENKTKVYFGTGGVKEHLGGLLKNYGGTVMLAYGGGSIRRNIRMLLADPQNYEARSELARASAMAENGILKIGKITDFRAVADSTVLTAGCCRKLTHDEIYDILCECR